MRVKESREQRARRLQSERAKKQLHTRLVSISITVALILLTCYYWPTKAQLEFIRSTKVPLATVVAFLALLKFMKGILCQHNYGLSKTHSCKKVFKVFIIILLTVLVFPITAEDQKKVTLTRNDGRFIYHYKGEAHINPKVIHQRRSYVPCDLATMATQMGELYNIRQNICDKNFDLNKDRPPLDNQSGKFIALNSTTSLSVAKSSCTALGLILPEIRGPTDIKDLRTFMATQGVASVFAGITFDRNQHLPVFNSDQSRANNTLENLKLIDHATNVETDWKEVIAAQRYSEYYQKTGMYFTYTSGYGIGMQLRVHYANRMGLRPVCSKNVYSYDPRDTSNWTQDCHASQRHLKVLIDDTKKVVSEIFPKVISRAKAMPHMIDRYHNPLTKRSAQSLYEEILNAHNTGNETICKQLYHAENLNVGIFGERAIIREELFGGKTEVRTHHMDKRNALSAVSMVITLITSAAVYFAQYSEQVTEVMRASFTSAKTLADLVRKSYKSIQLEDVTQIVSAVDTSNKLYERVRDQRRYILYYSKKIKENFYYEVSNPSPFVFLSESQYEETRTMIGRKYFVTPARHIKDLKVSTAVSQIAYEVFLTIPIDYETTKARIYHIIPFPIYKGNSSFLPIVPHNFFATSTKRGGEFTPILENELDNCYKNSFCELASPTYKAAIAPCGISNFFKNNSEMCQYRQMAYSLSHFYYTIDEWTYYSIHPNKSETVSLDCVSDVYSLGPFQIKEQGAIRLPIGCTGRDSQGTTFIPAQRKFHDPVYDYGMTHEIRPANTYKQPDDTILTSDQLLFLQELIDYDIFPYILLAVVILLFLSTKCFKQTSVSKLIDTLRCCIPSCGIKQTQCQSAMPFELEELMGDKDYATILRSPKLVKGSNFGGTPKPVKPPTVSFQLPTAPTDDSIQIPITSVSDLPVEEAELKSIRLHMKKFKDLEGYKYKCKLCETIFLSYGDLKSHIEDKHVSA